MAAIPGFDHNGNLPPGVHRAALSELGAALAWNRRRKRLLGGLRRALANLASAGVKRVWIGGSFVTNKEEPNDIDGCWEAGLSVNPQALDPVFLALDPPRSAMRHKYGVDFLVSGTPLLDSVPRGATVEEFLQWDRDGHRKGIAVVELGERT